MTYTHDEANRCKCGHIHTSQDEIAKRYGLIAEEDGERISAFHRKLFAFDINLVLRTNNECRKRALSISTNRDRAVQTRSRSR